MIDEKKVLSEKCNLLGQKIKEIEIKQQKDIKILLDRHVIELQRARELCLAGEKIRRERWLEAKTSKIRVLIFILNKLLFKFQFNSIYFLN